MLQVPDKFATVRDNPFTGQAEVLGVVGKAYTVLQNEEHAEFLNRLVDESGAIFDTAGSLCGGRQTFITMRLPKTMMIGGTDELTTNIAALNSHDGSSAFRFLLTPVRVVCANTQTAALRNNVASVTIRHTTNAKRQVEAVRSALGLTWRYVSEFEAEAEKMIQQTMTDAQFWALVEGIYGAPEATTARTVNRVNERNAQLAALWAGAPTQSGIRGTRWAGYQAIAEYVDHYSPVRTKQHDKNSARAARLLTAPEPANLKARAWRLAAVPG